MLQIKEKLNEFKSLIQVINNINEETTYTFTPNGILVRVVHVSNICMINAEINKNMFEIYDIKKETSYTINNKFLLLTLNKIGKIELNMEMKEEGLRLFNSNSEFMINYFVGPKDERPIPSLDNSCIWKVKPGVLFNLIGEMVEFSSIGQFISDDDLKLKIKAPLVEGFHKVSVVEEVKKSKCNSYYDMGFMIYISAIRHIFEEVNFEFGNNTLSMITAENDLVKFKWILACRVAENEE